MKGDNTPAGLLKLAELTLTFMYGQLEQYQDHAAIVRPPSLPIEALHLILASKFSDEALFHLIVSLSEHSAPHPSQILLCYEDMPPEVLQHFIQRIKYFPSISYLLVGVDKLPVDTREMLLRWVSKAVFKRKQVAHVDMIFLEQRGLEVFEFVQMEEKTSEIIQEERLLMAKIKKLKPSFLLHARGISVLEVFTGKASSGKTFAISHKTAQIPNRVVFSVVEEFKVSDFIQVFRKQILPLAGSKIPVMLHFNVSAYAPLHEFGQMLQHFLLWGVLWDTNTGEMVFVSRKNFVWSIFVEVSCAPNGDHQCPITSIEDATKYLPVLMYCATHVTDNATLAFELDDQALFCATVLNAHKSKVTHNLSQFCSVITAPIISQEAASAVLQPFLLERSSSMATQKRIVKLLYSKCIWLKKYALSMQKYAKEGSNLAGICTPGQLFDVFLEETKQISNTPLVVTPIYSCCSNTEPPSLSLLNFSGKPSTFSYITDELSVGLALNKQELLRQVVGQAFSSRPLYPIIVQQGYVLTPDFALKLLLLNDCRNARQNVILSGDTGNLWNSFIKVTKIGVGKTELLSILSLAINNDTELIPDIIQDACRHLSSDLQPFGLDFYTSKLNELTGTVIRLCELGEIEVPQKTPAKGEKAAVIKEKLFDLLRKSVIAFIQKELSKFTLIMPSPSISRVIDALKLDPNAMPVPQVDDLVRLLEEICTSRFQKIFHKILMHQHISAAEFRSKVTTIAEHAVQLHSMNPNITVVAFVDECTSTQVMGLLKEVFADHSLDGKPLPDNIFWVGALNRNDDTPIPLAKLEHLDFTGVDSGKFIQRAFAVRPPPLSLEPLMLEFGTLSNEQQVHFLDNLLTLRYHLGQPVGRNESEWRTLQKAIVFSQNFVRNENMHRVRVSIRDLVRAVDLYSYFQAHSEFIPLDEERFGSDEDRFIFVHHCSIILAMAIAYYFRLDSDGEPSARERYETGFPGVTLGIPRQYTFRKILDASMMHLFKNTKLPVGIAPTFALLQNLFCTVVCIDARIPLIIVGPPGCSKTLSFKIAVDNMKGSQSPMIFFRSLGNAQPFRYQCSQQSTDTEIKSVYKQAISRQKTFDKTAHIQQEQQRCVVLLDEAGLPPEETASLKVLHYLLDHPKVGSVILSNVVLDAAKTNRAVLVKQSTPSSEDLLALANGCIFSDKVTDERRELALKALCIAYQQANVYAPVKDMFHLRDFVYFLRYIGRNQRQMGQGICPDVLVRSLQRNFGGLEPASFYKLVTMFFSVLQGNLRVYNDRQWESTNIVSWIFGIF